MKSFFRTLPLPFKLILIGILPIGFIIYLSTQLFYEKSQEVRLIGDYIETIHETANITSLMSALQMERRFSYEYALKRNLYDSVLVKRKVTDAAILLLKQNKNLAVANFPEYTFIKNLPAIREALDTSKTYSANAIMDFYTTAIFRLNTLKSFAPASNVYLSSIYQDLISQNLLLEMMTFLGIIRTNIYNVLYTREYMVETMIGTVGTYNIYKTYETEFLLKASPFIVVKYKYLKASTDLHPTAAYIDRLFTTFKFDSSYTADSWWATSANGFDAIHTLEEDLWKRLERKMNDIYSKANAKKNDTLKFLVIAVVLVIVFISYTIKVISEVLKDLKIAAQKISTGNTNIHLENMPDDVIGKVAVSILRINENNKRLANAAEAIGKGNFKVDVVPRSSADILGNAIVQMKNDLLQYAMQKDRIQNETMDLVHKKDEFMSIASHELKTPVTSLKAYTQILQMHAAEAGNHENELMFGKMDAQINKLSLLINDLLDTSRLREGELIYNRHPFQFEILLEETIDEVQRMSSSYKMVLKNNPPVKIFADRERIGQVITNLLTNAIKYCMGCDILINVEIKHNELACSIHDDGVGISKDQQDKIFERFYRVSGVNLHTYPGLGLGLYISKEIIQRHEGKIYVESEPKKGTTFYFTLPMYEE